MVLDLGLVGDDLPVEAVHGLIDGRVEIFVRLLDDDALALHTQRDHDRLAMLLFGSVLDLEEDVDAHDLVEVTRRPLEFREQVLTEGRRHLEMVTSDGQIHSSCLLFPARSTPPCTVGKSVPW